MIRRRFINKVVEVEELPYLTIKALEDGLTVKLSTNACQYSTDGVVWTDLSAGTTTPAINKGKNLYFKATGLTPTSSAGIGTFTVSKQFNLLGNCMSMLFGDEAESNLDLTGYDYAFYRLFYKCITLKSVSTGFLPATTLATNCYADMFRGCTELTTAPELPAIILTDYCYYYMFQNCTKLTIAPELPAMTLANRCYGSMFLSCSGLTTAPKLPATILMSRCYFYMFYGCISLTTAPELPATTLVDFCYDNMFSGCSNLNYIKAMFTTTPSSSYTNNWVSGVASTGTFVKNAAATWDVTGTSGVPSGWTITTEQVTIESIEFTIDGISYQAEEYMTWKEWANSEYNTDGYSTPMFGLGEIPINSPDNTKTVHIISNSSVSQVYSSEFIISQGNYITR